MILRYADPSALAAIYLADHPDHLALRASLLQAELPVLASQLARVEVASAMMAAERGSRVASGRAVIAEFDAACRAGLVTLLAFDADLVMPRAIELVRQHPVHALDAIHLAVALEQAQSLSEGDRVVFVTRDQRQATAARALGFTVE